MTITVEHIAPNGLQGGYGIFVANKNMQSVTIHRGRHKSAAPAPPPPPASPIEEVADFALGIAGWVLSVILVPTAPE